MCVCGHIYTGIRQKGICSRVFFGGVSGDEMCREEPPLMGIDFDSVRACVPACVCVCMCVTASVGAFENYV